MESTEIDARILPEGDVAWFSEEWRPGDALKKWDLVHTYMFTRGTGNVGLCIFSQLVFNFEGGYVEWAMIS